MTTVDDRVAGGETIERRYEGEETWLRTDRRFIRETVDGIGTLSLDAVEGTYRISGDRNTPYLVAGLAALTLAVVLPTAAVGGGVPFFTVAPIALVLAVASPVGLILWYRSSTVFLQLRVDEPVGSPWRLPDSDEVRRFFDGL
jgi:hypothetical protein